jgi:hypothetical protein
VTAEGETWVWADGTIYDPSIPGYRQATADELRRNVTADDDIVELRAQIAEALAALGAKDATNYERVQAAGLILSRPGSTSRQSAPDTVPWPNSARRDTTDSARRPGETVVERRPR